MTVGNTAGRSKSTHAHPTTGTQTTSTKNARRSVPYEHQQLKKFVQAMNDPDWRDRGSLNSSESSLRDTLSIEAQCGTSDRSSTSLSNEDCQCEGVPGQDNEGFILSNPCRTEKNDIVDVNNAPLFNSINTDDAPLPRHIKGKSLYVARPMHALLDDNTGLSLFEVVPVDSKQGIPSSSLSHNIVEIQPFEKKSRKARVNSDKSQNEQLTAALEAADITPRKVRIHTSTMNRLEEALNCCAYHSGCQVRMESPKVPIMTATQSHRRRDPNSSQDQSSSGHFPGPMDCQQRLASEIKPDNAFQKMLQKLTRNRGQVPKTAVRAERDSGYEENSGTETNMGESASISKRYPVLSIGRRMGTVSDPCGSHVSGNKSHRKEDTTDSTDSGVCMEEHVGFKTLNPRAREFLSFINSQGPNTAEKATQSFKPFSLQSLAEKGGKPAGPLGEHSTPSTTSGEPVPPYEPIVPIPTASVTPITFGTNVVSPPILHNLFTGNALSLATNPFQSQLSGPAIPLPLPPPPGLGPQPVLQPIAGSLLGLPPTPLVTTLFPVAGPVDPCFVAPACPFPHVEAVPRPPPVPKPRRPDPRDQQAYEAWIEWRKANEPGYALECRLRQQRRAQKGVTNFQLEKQPEVTTSA